MRLRFLLLALVLLSGCAAVATLGLDQRFGPAVPERLNQPVLATADVPSYQQQIKPLLERRCVVCHGCYDAPCQLKLGSWEGVARGSSQNNVYDRLRLNDAEPSRLGLDAHGAAAWREQGFSPVLNDRDPSPANHLAASVLWRSLQLKTDHPLPAQAVLSDNDFDFSLDRHNSCPRLDEFDAFARQQPRAGMPYGLPGLQPQELHLIQRWLQAGAPDDPAPTLPAELAQQVATWEAFLNGPSLREQLVGRYLYEHLFLGSLVFDGDAQRQVFRLVRSATPPGQPVQVLATRRPFDDPGVARPWYRLQPERETVLAKTHMPYVLSAARLARWRQWFVQTPFQVKALPSYAPEVAANPFRSFVALPLASRYRFLLDDAGYYVMNFIKGPVCRGNIALDVIRDRFWVFFVDPTLSADDDAAQAVAREGELMKLPAAVGEDPSLLAWRDIAKAEDRLLAAKTATLARKFGGPQRINLNFIWDGDGHNPNAALTILRHYDSASVVQGLVGEPPRTAWVIGYPLLERIYYLLVAGYDVFGNTAHQLQTRLAMDFLRMEGEANLLMLLPRDARLPLRDAWYRGVGDEVKQRILGGPYRFDAETGVPFPPGTEPLPHLYSLLQQRLAPVLAQPQGRRFELSPANVPDAAERQALQALAQVRGKALQWWPEASLLRLVPGANANANATTTPPRTYSLLRNTAHRNVSTLLREPAMLEPQDNSLTVVPGFIGAYPNAVFELSVAELPAFTQALARLGGESDYRRLANRWAVRRTSAHFWATSDALMDDYQRWDPAEAGLLDWSRLENR